MTKVRVRQNSSTHKLLRQLAIGGGLIVVSLVAPQAVAGIANKIISSYFRRNSFERQRFLNDLKNLQTKELIDFRELGDGSVRIKLHPKGRSAATQLELRYQLDTLELTPRPWDKRWRLVLFDIPHEHKRGRDAVARKLRALGMYPLQKSAYMTPHPCEKEVDFVTTIFDVQKYVLILTVSSFEGEEKMKNHFGIG